MDENQRFGVTSEIFAKCFADGPTIDQVRKLESVVDNIGQGENVPNDPTATPAIKQRNIHSVGKEHFHWSTSICRTARRKCDQRTMNAAWRVRQVKY